MSLKQNRAASFAVVTLVCLLASAAGMLVYIKLPCAFWLNLLIADIAATVVTFLFSVVFSNASVYDPYWSVQPVVIVSAFAVGVPLTKFRLLLLIAIWFWGVRLTANWAYTFKGLDHQDWRYTMLHEQTGGFYPAVNFVGIHLVPTLIVYACVLPAVFAFRYDAADGLLSRLFILLSVAAVILQGTADWQMHNFRRQQRGGFIRTGLWKYSRHPNYLGEILMWWGIALAVFAAMPSRWYLCLGAFANTLLFLFVSIPMADRRQGKKSGFASYKRQTRMLFPLPKREFVMIEPAAETVEPVYEASTK